MGQQPSLSYLQDKYHLYFLFDLMMGGDLMDVLVAEAKVIKRRIAQGAWRRACLAPKVGSRCGHAFRVIALCRMHGGRPDSRLG